MKHNGILWYWFLRVLHVFIVFDLPAARARQKGLEKVYSLL